MPSSTSSFRKPTARDVALLLLACALFCATMELGAAFGFGRLSQIERRRQTEYRAALATQSSKGTGATSVLVVGNSLLLHGVNFPQLQQELGLAFSLRRLVVENTFYLDWYYGLRHMFRMGARPDVVVVVLNPIQLTSSSFDGDYAAHMLVDRRDLFAFGKDVSADKNAISSLALANLSFFYGTRTEIRSWILDRILPGLPHLFHMAPTAPKTATLADIAAVRMTRLQGLCAQNGADLLIVFPPARVNSDADLILQAAAADRVKVLSPIAPGVLPSSDYSDNFHLNASGAGKFTPAVAAQLLQILSRNKELPETPPPASSAANLLRANKPNAAKVAAR